MKHCFCLLISFLFFASLWAKEKHSVETESWLLRLDSVIQQRQVFDAMKSKHLSEMYKKKESLRSTSEILSFNTQM